MRKTLTFLLLGCATLQADEDTFRERFADPASRASAISELVPGTRDAFFHTALDHQLAGRDVEFRKTLIEWKSAADAKDSTVSLNGYELLETRQFLTDYQKAPEVSLAGLIRRLDLKFDDTRPDAAAAARSLPTRIEPEWIAETAFEKAAAEKAKDAPYTGYRKQRILRELDRVETFDEAKIRWFIENLDRADLPGVVPLVDRSLSLEKPIPFGSKSLHYNLTSIQLESLLELHPTLRSSEKFVMTYLRKLRPGSGIDFKRDRSAHAAHLQRCRDIALTLPPALGSLKAHVLYHHLRLQSELGNHPKADLLAYLALPRANHAILRIPEHQTAAPINCEADYSEATECPPVGDDALLILSLLQHILGTEESAADFVPLIEQKQLARIQAKAKLLAGSAPERWSSVLDPAEFKVLQDEAYINFAPGAPVLLDADAAVTLDLDLKNTPDLLVRIYEIDLPAHLRKHHTEPTVSIDLDGLVPHNERRITYHQSSIIEHRESIELPELAGPGVWLVELVSGQVSARSLIRKGSLIPYLERSANGQILRGLDEKGELVTDAVLHLGGEMLPTDASGRIQIPNSAEHPATHGTLVAGKLAAPVRIESRLDPLKLEARFHVEREQLLADRQARLLLRVRLTNHGHEIPLEQIKDPALVLKAGLLGGVTTERVIAENLKLSAVMEVPFQVPADLLDLSFTLRGTITPATGGEPVKLSASASYQLNADLKTARIANAYVSPTEAGHRLEVRGRNGEPMPSRALTISAHRHDYTHEIIFQVRTDELGQIDLGKLDGIDWLEITGSGIAKQLYDPILRSRSYAERIQVPNDSEIRLPLAKSIPAPDRLEFSLMEYHGENPLRDHFDKIIIENGQLVIRKLPPGTFKLTQGGETTEVLVSAGVEKDGLIVSRNLIQPLHRPLHPTIATAKAEGNQLRIQLRDFGPDTRISLIGARYRHGEWDAGSGLHPFAPAISQALIPGFNGCGYITGRRLSDEMRYILDRRAVKTFPGNMLPRPGLLLNRWTQEEIGQNNLEGTEGHEGNQPTGSSMDAASGGSPYMERPDHFSSEHGATCDFIGVPAVVRFDLAPAADGSLVVDMKDFKSCQFLEIVATDAFASEQWILPLPASETPLRDCRIARPLDPGIHYQAKRSAAVLAKGATASIDHLLDADWRAFTTLTDVHQFLYGMTGDDRLREFVFLTEWPDFTEARKLELLSRHACHELHLFLARRDRPFFEKYVQPSLSRKPEPGFMDDYLLGRDLALYLRPYAWQRLNAAEKALLTQAVPDAAKRISRELSLRWELEAPAPDEETALFTQTLRGTDLALEDSLGLASVSAGSEEVSGTSYLSEKLRRIVIPQVNFQDTTVEEAIDFLRLRAAERDTIELDPAKRGINIVVRAGVSHRIKDLRVSNVPIATVLKYICDQTKLRYKVDDFAVILVPQTETGEDIMTRVFQVPPDFAEGLSGDDGEPGDVDPFAEPDASPRKLASRKPIMEILKAAGISFPEGSTATLSASGALLVTNTPMELDKIKILTSTIGAHSNNAPSDAGLDPGLLPPLDADPFADQPGAAKMTVRKPPFPDRTKLWRESDYYRNTAAEGESLIPLNRFWLDLAAWDGKGAFLSPHFNACHRSANEALMCLALLDMPFKAERPEVSLDGSTLRVKAKDPMLLFYKDTRRAEKVAQESPLLVRQSFTPLAEKLRTVKGREEENPVLGDFRPGVAYSASLIVTNPTGMGRRVDVLAQIPAGSIPLDGQAATLSTTKEIAAHGVLKLELAFYFPAVGDFPVYPMHVSEDGVVLSHTAPRTLRVSNNPASKDKASWGVLAAEASDEEVLNRLRSENLDTIHLKAIRWRLRDRAFFRSVTAILRERLHYSADVSSFGFLHNDSPALRDYMENSNLVRELGQWLDSPLLEIRPRIHLDWQSLEFDPLINPRAHRFTSSPRITHQAALSHYHAFLDQLAWKPALDDADHLGLAFFLFLQDRIEEALARFDKIDAAKLSPSYQLSYAYLSAVAGFYRGDPQAAKATALESIANLPPGTWRDRFQAVIDQAAEVAALETPDESSPEEKQPVAPHLELALGNDGKLVIEHRGLEQANLQLFSVDLEVMFSKNPFLRHEGGEDANPSIRPNESLQVELRKDVSSTTIDIPEALRKGNVLVSAESGATKVLKVLDSRALEIRHAPQSREIQVLHAVDHKPLGRAYIKVYAENLSGEIVFHKDGYTDLRGKMDYLSHTGTDPSSIKRVALLISHPEKGARTVIYDR